VSPRKTTPTPHFERKSLSRTTHPSGYTPISISTAISLSLQRFQQFNCRMQDQWKGTAGRGGKRLCRENLSILWRAHFTVETS
jgi:hypothetical protein